MLVHSRDAVNRGATVTEDKALLKANCQSVQGCSARESYSYINALTLFNAEGCSTGGKQWERRVQKTGRGLNLHRGRRSLYTREAVGEGGLQSPLEDLAFLEAGR